MSKQEKEIKALLEALEEEKDSTTGKARAIRRKLRTLGYFLSKINAKSKKSKDEDEDEDEKKSTKKSKVKKSTKSKDEDDDED